MSAEPWFQQDGGPWHKGMAVAQCGVRVDYRTARTALLPDAEAPRPRCLACVTASPDRHIRELDEEIAELQRERAEAVAKREALLRDAEAAG